MMYLPIGSIVLLKGQAKRTLIYGRNQINIENGKSYDYVGCGYPEGYVSETEKLYFNHSDIELLFAIGYQNFEELKLRAALSAGMEAK